MPDYEIFGGCLRSDLPLHELREIGGVQPNWTFRIAEERPPMGGGGAELLGEDVTGVGTVHLYRSPAGFRVEYNDTGTYDVSPDGREIVWYRVPDADMDLVHTDVMGRVLAVALHASGVFCLHGSAVAVGESCAAFLAPKRHGKSTLAVALTAAGARLMTDDTLAVDLGGRPMAWPGVHCVRLWPDSERHLRGQSTADDGGSRRKAQVGDFALDELMRERMPLGALYLLRPVKAENGAAAVRRVQLAPMQAAIALVKNTKLGGLLGKSETPTVLRQAGAVAEAVPVYLLEVVRDLGRIAEVVETIMSWHGQPSGAPATAATSR
jgi:hypothetical protein